MTDYLWLLVALPLVGATVNLFLGKRLGEPRAGWFAFAVVAAGFLLSAAATVGFITDTQSPETIYLFSWIPVVGADAAILWDPLAALLTVIVTGVGSLIHLYSIGYMHGDDRFPRFFAFLNLFIASMLILVLAANYAVMFVGWELVGLSSYLLISFWFTKPSAAAAGKKAFVVNRIGDWGFLIALMIIFATFGTFDFQVIFEEAPVMFAAGSATITAITLLLAVAAAGKSAQIPLYVWLPDAMEGPTPVSALIHAATMVTAGVFLIARSAVLFDLAPVSSAIVAVVGVLTALLAAVIAVAQTDIKRVLAYSTISQLGYMVLAVGAGAFTAGLFHLMTHAFFKALLFLGAGSVIHAMADQQDMRRMGGLRKYMPITFGTMAAAWLAISGIFPFSGFWSKDEVLASVFGRGGGYYVLWAIGLVVSLLTAFYMTRLFTMTFLGKQRWDDGVEPHESPRSMTVPLVVLAVFSVVAGFINTPFRLTLEHFLEPSFEGVPVPELPSDGVLVILALITLAVAVSGLAAAWRRYTRDELPAEDASFWRNALDAYGVDDWYGRLIVAPGKAASTWFAQVVDPKVIDGAAHGIGRAVVDSGDGATVVQSGQVRWYAGVIAVGGVVLIALFLFLGGAF